MENDVIIQMGIVFFCIALLTFWFKKRWKKKPETKIADDSRNKIGGKWTADEPEPEPPERPQEPEPEPPEKEP